jgi:hypothetical protein
VPAPPCAPAPGDEVSTHLTSYLGPERGPASASCVPPATPRGKRAACAADPLPAARRRCEV